MNAVSIYNAKFIILYKRVYKTFTENIKNEFILITFVPK